MHGVASGELRSSHRGNLGVTDMIAASRISTIALTIALLAPAAARAAISFNSSAYDSAPAHGQALVVDFDDPNAAGFAFTGGGIYQGLTANVAAPPAGDVTHYAAVLGGQVATLTSSQDLSSFSLYIGSIDRYNTLTFSGPDGFSKSYTGADLYLPANGDQGAGETNRRFDFDFDGVKVNQVSFQSSENSFEFDNIAVRTVSAAPEPGVWLLMMLGVAMLGAVLGRRERAAPAAVQASALG